MTVQLQSHHLIVFFSPTIPTAARTFVAAPCPRLLQMGVVALRELEQIPWEKVRLMKARRRARRRPGPLAATRGFPRKKLQLLNEKSKYHITYYKQWVRVKETANLYSSSATSCCATHTLFTFFVAEMSSKGLPLTRTKSALLPTAITPLSSIRNHFAGRLVAAFNAS